MSFHRFSESERNAICKEHIGSLEFWLRRLIDNELRKHYGNDYQNFIKKGKRLFSANLVGDVDHLFKRPGKNFNRWIDATLIEHLITIVLHPNVHNIFHPFFTNFVSVDHLRIDLDKIAEVRNTVYHGNPVTVRQVEQTVCYANDIIESIQKQYLVMNKNKEFNAPTFLKFDDSVGGTLHIAEFRSNGIFVIDRRNVTIYDGDTISLEVEVDANFPRNEYKIQWSITEDDASHTKVKLTEENISESFWVDIRVISLVKNWHRYKHFDDRIQVAYRVAPVP